MSCVFYDKPEFELAEIYESEEKLAKLHPANRHVRDKIRQQLQVLRDIGILEFRGAGQYSLR
jgi:type II restriction enzyme